MESVAVAFSGGVDSAVVAKAAYLALGEAAVAVTAHSPSVAQQERDDASRIARQIGIRHVIIRTEEFSNAAYRHPLQEAGFTKADVRELAREWKLPIWDKPASPCLSSRLVPGLAVTPERTKRIEAADA